MTILVILGLLAAGAVIALATYGLLSEYRRSRYWRRHNERMAAYHERMAAQNGRPHTDAVTMRATRRD